MGSSDGGRSQASRASRGGRDWADDYHLRIVTARVKGIDEPTDCGGARERHGVDGAAPERAAADAQLWARVRELPEKQRLAVAYRFVADLAYREIGEAMGTSEEAARRNVFEGLRALRAQEALTATR